MSTRPHTRSKRSMHSLLQGLALNAEVFRLRTEQGLRRGRRNAIILRKGGGLSEALSVMKAGDRLEDRAAPGPSSLAVREGSIRFTTADGRVEAGPETLVACDAARRHAVETLEDVVCPTGVAKGSG